MVKKNKDDSKDNQIEEDIKKLKGLNFSNKDIVSVLSVLKGYNKNLIKKMI